jgi:transposase InsO family protein
MDTAVRDALITGYEALIAHVPYRIHTILTDNGVQFALRPDQDRYLIPLFERICRVHSIEHRFTNPNHPWTNGQVERMNRTLKEATVHRYFYATADELDGHLQTFLAAYNLAKRLKTLKGLTPFEFICQKWQFEPHRFTSEPFHLNLGLYL